MQDYLLTNRTRAWSIQITRARFEELVSARREYASVVELEEEFSLVFDSLQDFERYLMELTLDQLFHGPDDWGNWQSDIYTANRHLNGLLSVAKLYLDHAQRRLSVNPDLLSAFKAATAHEYDTRLGYRTCEALRNHLQHFGLASHGMTLRGDTDGDQVRHQVRLRIEVDQITRNRDFKKKLLSELASFGPSISVTPLVRDYVEGLGGVHAAVRAALLPRVGSWEAVLRSALADARSAAGDPNLKVVAVRRMDQDVIREEEWILVDFLERRSDLRKRTAHAASISRHFVSSDAEMPRLEPSSS